MRRMAQRLPLLANGQQCHGAITAAAGLRFVANTHQGEATGLPEPPQRLGIAEADGKKIQPLRDAFLLFHQPAGDPLLT
ncbi:hypothetical protein D3C72_2167310 [compost metagenome]